MGVYGNCVYVCVRVVPKTLAGLVKSEAGGEAAMKVSTAEVCVTVWDT